MANGRIQIYDTCTKCVFLWKKSRMLVKWIWVQISVICFKWMECTKENVNNMDPVICPNRYNMWIEWTSNLKLGKTATATDASNRIDEEWEFSWMLSIFFIICLSTNIRINRMYTNKGTKQQTNERTELFAVSLFCVFGAFEWKCY